MDQIENILGPDNLLEPVMQNILENAQQVNPPDDQNILDVANEFQNFLQLQEVLHQENVVQPANPQPNQQPQVNFQMTTTRTEKIYCPVMQKVAFAGDWYVDLQALHQTGYQESPHFGGCTSFYWRIEHDPKKGRPRAILYLAEHANRESIQILNGQVLIALAQTGNKGKKKLKGLVSKRSSNLGTLSFRLKTPFYGLSTVLQFEELDGVANFDFNLALYHSLKLAQRQYGLLPQEAVQEVSISGITADGKTFIAGQDELRFIQGFFPEIVGKLDGTPKEGKGSPLADSPNSDNSGASKQNHRFKFSKLTGEEAEALFKFVETNGAYADFAERLLPLAIQHKIPVLIVLCIRSMMANLRAENAAKFLSLADQFRLEDHLYGRRLKDGLSFKQRIAAFIRANKKAVRKSSAWKEFIEGNAALMEHLIMELM